MNRKTQTIYALLLIAMLVSLPCRGFADAPLDLTAVSDGIADASAVLQKVIDSSDGDVRLPPGKFRLSRSLIVDLAKSGLRSISGSTATVLQIAGPEPALVVRGTHFKSADPAGVADKVWKQERMPVFSGFAIEGAHHDAIGIEATGTMQLTIRGVHLRKLLHGIHLVENNRNVLIEGCHIYENHGCGVFYDNVNLHQSNIVGCHISYCKGGGVVSRQGNVRNLHITGCDLESNMGAEQPATANVLIDCRDSNYGTAEVAITGCTIQHNDLGPESANIRIIGSSNPLADGEPRNEGNITITGNVLSDVQHNLWLDGCRGVTITGNTLWMGFQDNLLIENCSSIVMGANNFDRNPRYAYGHAADAKNGIVFRNSRDCTITGLHITEVNHDVPALTIIKCQRMNLVGITILDCDLGLKLVDVHNSSITGCLIQDRRPNHQNSKAFTQEKCTRNRIDVWPSQ